MGTKKHVIYTIIFCGLLLSLLISGCTADKQDPYGGGEEFEIPADEFARGNLQGETLEERFSLKESLYRVEQVGDIFVSFRELTEECQGKLPPETLAAVGNTGWEMQHLGFHNLPNTIEGTLRLQDYEIKKLRFALAKEQYEKGEIGVEDAKGAQEAFYEARDGMQAFLDSYSIAD
ncbi:MAG: hypothetical protein GX376_03825 [Firmicutes bacterium]|nr:hypothetical protein [Bacillota bacterium]